MGWNHAQVELLVLSACSTAKGDEYAELGFAGLAVQAGVKSALATLWRVSDRIVKSQISKISAYLLELPEI